VDGTFSRLERWLIPEYQYAGYGSCLMPVPTVGVRAVRCARESRRRARLRLFFTPSHPRPCEAPGACTATSSPHRPRVQL